MKAQSSAKVEWREEKASLVGQRDGKEQEAGGAVGRARN